MYSKNRMKIMIGAFTGLGVILLVTLIYAAFTRQLNISGTSVNRKSKFDIHFEELSTITTTGTAKALTQPRIASPTSIEDYSVSETSPGDTISFTFKVVNDGNYDASISSLSVGTPECSGTDSTSNSNVCGKLIYSLTYEDGASVQTGDILNAKDNVTMKMTLTYQEFNDASLLPTEDVSISNLGITINYQQSGNALVKDNGEVADYKVYHVGDKITLNNEDYYVIANSGIGQDYVTVALSRSLSGEEIDLYGGVGTVDNHVNRYTQLSVGTSLNGNTFEGVAFYSSETCGYVNDNLVRTNCISSYDESDIKYIVDNWTSSKFNNNELKTINNYSSRIMSVAEVRQFCTNGNFDCTGWISNGAYYEWLLDSTTYKGQFATLYHTRISSDLSYVIKTYEPLSVRPVINVYKSALETNNNNNNE